MRDKNIHSSKRGKSDPSGEISILHGLLYLSDESLCHSSDKS